MNAQGKFLYTASLISLFHNIVKNSDCRILFNEVWITTYSPGTIALRSRALFVTLWSWSGLRVWIPVMEGWRTKHNLYTIYWCMHNQRFHQKLIFMSKTDVNVDYRYTLTSTPNSRLHRLLHSTKTLPVKWLLEFKGSAACLDQDWACLLLLFFTFSYLLLFLSLFFILSVVSIVLFLSRFIRFRTMEFMQTNFQIFFSYIWTSKTSWMLMVKVWKNFHLFL